MNGALKLALLSSGGYHKDRRTTFWRSTECIGRATENMKVFGHTMGCEGADAAEGFSGPWSFFSSLRLSYGNEYD
jgi:hypothetical protein